MDVDTFEKYQRFMKQKSDDNYRMYDMTSCGARIECGHWIIIPNIDLLHTVSCHI